jgi:hypothetical protein
MRSGFAFGAFLDAKQLMVPEALEFIRPLVQGLDGLRVRLIEHLAAVASHPNETDLAEYAKVLGNGRLLQAKARDDVAHGTLLRREIAEDVAAARFGDGVKGIGGGGGSRHGQRIHAYMGICKGVFLWSPVAQAFRPQAVPSNALATPVATLPFH